MASEIGQESVRVEEGHEECKEIIRALHRKVRYQDALMRTICEATEELAARVRVLMSTMKGAKRG